METEFFQRWLRPEERLLWTGHPGGWPKLRRKEIVNLVLGGLICWAMLPNVGDVVHTRSINFFTLCFTLFGLWCLLAPLVRLVFRRIQRRYVCYGITNQRVLVGSTVLQSSLETVELERVSLVQFIPGLSGRGTIVLNSFSDRSYLSMALVGFRSYDLMALEGIEPAKAVYRLLLEAQSALFAGDGEGDLVTESPEWFERLPGERLLWTGKPYDGPMAWKKQDILRLLGNGMGMLVFGGLMVYFLVASFAQLTAMDVNAWIVSVPLLLIFSFFSGRVLWQLVRDIMRRGGTFYALTDRRALIRQTGWGKWMKSVYWPALPIKELLPGKDGRGTIVWGKSLPWFQFYELKNADWPIDEMPAFEGIENAAEVYRLVNA